MPNHTLNRLVITGPAGEIARLQQAVVLNPEQGKNQDGSRFSFLPLIDRPPEISGNITGLEQADFASKAEYELAKEKGKQRRLRRYGAEDWHIWSLSFWGTKWDAYGHADEGGFWKTQKHGVSCQFDTAWSPPERFLDRLALHFPALAFKLRTVDEGGGFNCLLKWRHGGALNEAADALSSDEAVKALLAIIATIGERGEIADYVTITGRCYMATRGSDLMGTPPGLASPGTAGPDCIENGFLQSILRSLAGPLRQWHLATVRGLLMPLSPVVDSCLRHAMEERLLVAAKSSGAYLLTKKGKVAARSTAALLSELRPLPTGMPQRSARLVMMAAVYDTIANELGRPPTVDEFATEAMGVFRVQWDGDGREWAKLMHRLVVPKEK